MEKYIIYCTEEQTKKALELGASISNHKLDSQYKEKLPKDWLYYDGACYHKVTAEQMIGWLEEQGQSIEVSRLYRGNTNWSTFVDDTQIVGEYYPTRKEALLAGIDVALDSILNQKQQV